MKHSVKNYGKALSELLLENKSKNIGRNFLLLLQKNGDMKKAKAIVALAEVMLLKKNGAKKVILETARKLQSKNTLKSFVKKGDAVEEKINPELVAGIKIVVNGEKQLDFSLQKKLNEVFE